VNPALERTRRSSPIPATREFRERIGHSVQSALALADLPHEVVPLLVGEAHEVRVLADPHLLGRDLDRRAGAALLAERDLERLHGAILRCVKRGGYA
jgi:hypothetical protein